MTNEREVIKTKAKLVDLKADFMKALKAYIATPSKSDAEAEKATLEVQAKAIAYFNFAEEFVGNSDLLGAHKNERWAQGFAEDCLAILESMPGHYGFLETAFKKISNLQHIDFRPSATAYANMQRMVVEYLNVQVVQEIRKIFLEKGLPVYGFDNPVTKKSSEHQDKIISCSIGGLLLVIVLILTFVFDKPTAFQQAIIWGTFAMALAGLAAIIPGFLQIDWRKRAGLAAGGALAVFVLVYFFPPSPIPNNSTNSVDFTASETPSHPAKETN